MGKRSVKEDKNIFQLAREEAGLTRAAAADATVFITEGRIEKIESGKTLAQPEDVLVMSKAYKKPGLCNSYCANICPIGRENVSEVELKDLSEIILQILASINSMSREKDRLVDISVDGVIDDTELPDFVRIKKELEKTSLAVDMLKLWVNNTIAEGKINKKKLDELMND